MAWFRYDKRDLEGLEDRYYKIKYSKIPANEEWLDSHDESHPEYRHWSKVVKELREELRVLEREIEEAKRDIEEQERREKEKSKSGGGWFW